MASQKCLLLLSGGIDSPAAAYLAQQQGFEVIAVHFASKFIGRNPEEKCRDACRQLKISKLLIVNASPAFEQFAKQCEHGQYFVLMKRFMVKVSEKIAQKENCDFLVTGENLAQVSSQTLQNLLTIQSAVKIPIARPLLSFDKQEIIELAKKIKTYEISIGPESCDILGSKHPNTQVKQAQAEAEEQKLNYPKLVSEALESVHLLKQF